MLSRTVRKGENAIRTGDCVIGTKLQNWGYEYWLKNSKAAAAGAFASAGHALL